MKSLGIIQPSFWQPYRITTQPQDMNLFFQGFVRLGELADSYLSLHSHGSGLKVVSRSGQYVVQLHKERLNKGATATYKVFSYIFLAPIAVIALAIKCIYKQALTKTLVSSLEPLTGDELLNALTPDEKRIMIQDLPSWFENHLSNSRTSTEFDNFSYISDEDLDQVFKKQIDHMIVLLSDDSNRRGRMLRGMTISTDPLLAPFTKRSSRKLGL